MGVHKKAQSKKRKQKTAVDVDDHHHPDCKCHEEFAVEYAVQKQYKYPTGTVVNDIVGRYHVEGFTVEIVFKDGKSIRLEPTDYQDVILLKNAEEAGWGV